MLFWFDFVCVRVCVKSHSNFGNIFRKPFCFLYVSHRSCDFLILLRTPVSGSSSLAMALLHHKKKFEAMKVPMVQGISLNRNQTVFSEQLSSPLTDSNGISFSHTVSDEMPLMPCHEDNRDIMI